MVLQYQKFKRQAVLNINDETELFSNQKIRRKLNQEAKVQVLEELCSSKNAVQQGKNSGVYEIYWNTLDEWTNLVYGWAVNSGMTNSVLTLYELLHGDDTVDQEFHGLDESVFMKILKHLEGKGKGEVIELDGNYGVKIF